MSHGPTRQTPPGRPGEVVGVQEYDAAGGDGVTQFDQVDQRRLDHADHVGEPLAVDAMNRIGPFDELRHPEAKLIAGDVVAAAGKQQGVECPVVGVAQIVDDALALFDAEHLRRHVAVMRQIKHQRVRRAVGLDPSDGVARQRVVEPGVAFGQNVKRHPADPRLQGQAAYALHGDGLLVLGNARLAFQLDLGLRRFERHHIGIGRCHPLAPLVTRMPAANSARTPFRMQPLDVFYIANGRDQGGEKPQRFGGRGPNRMTGGRGCGR